jgi:hypothetical protein
MSLSRFSNTTLETRVDFRFETPPLREMERGQRRAGSNVEPGTVLRQLCHLLLVRRQLQLTAAPVPASPFLLPSLSGLGSLSLFPNFLPADILNPISSSLPSPPSQPTDVVCSVSTEEVEQTESPTDQPDENQRQTSSPGGDGTKLFLISSSQIS